MVVDVVAEAHGDAVAHGADDELGEVAAEVGEEGEEEVAQGNGQEAAPEAVEAFEVGQGVGHPKGEVGLVEGEGGQLGRGLGGAEEEFDEGDYHDEGEHVEQDGQHVEGEVARDVPGVELQVTEYSPDRHGTGSRVCRGRYRN